MKNLKKLFAVVVVVAMMATIMAPAFAAGAYSYEAEAQVLNDLGLYQGTSTTEFVPDLGSALNRETGVVMLLRLFNLTDEAEAITDADATLAKFSDAASISSWAKKSVAYAVENGIVVGLPDGTFAPKAALNGKAYCKMILVQLGYTPDYDNAPAELADKGGLSVLQAVKFTEKSLIRDDLVGISYGALKAEYSDGATVVEKLVAANPDLEEVATTAGLVEAVAIDSLASVPAVKCEVGETPTLPATVAATYSDKTTADVAVTWDAVDTTKAGTVTVAGTVEGTDLKASVTVTVEEPTLTIDSVTAPNLKEMLVAFNMELDKDTVTTANIKVKKSGVLVGGYTVELQSDNKTVLVKAATTTGFDNQTTYTVTGTKDVKNTAGVAMVEKTVEVKPFDATLPEVKAIKVTGPKNLEIEFSEPIKDIGTRSIALKAGTATVGVNSTFTNYDNNVIKVALLSSLTDGKTYTATIKGFEDFAGYKMINYTGDFAYAADKAEITATIEKAEQTYVVVKFNKPVKNITKEYFYHTFSAWKPYAVYSDENTTAIAGAVDKVWVRFADGDTGYPIAEGTTKLVIKDKVNDTAIKDNWDNEFKGAELPLTVTADKTAPTVTELSVDSEKVLKVKFDEDVDFTTDNIEVLNGDGTKNSDIKLTVDGSGKEYTVDIGEDMSGKSILVNIKNVEDKALTPNKLALYTKTLDVTDKTAPSVSKVTTKIIGGGEQALYVFFNEAVDDTATVKDNYYIVDGATWKKVENTPEFYDGDKVVRIELTDDEKATIEGGADVAVKDVKDIAGNAMVVSTTLAASILAYDDGANAPTVEKVEAIAKDKVAVTFDQYLSDVDAAAFQVNGDDPAGMELSTNDDGNTVVTLTTDDAAKFTYDVSGAESVVINTNPAKVANIFDVDAADVTLNIGSTPALVDKICPEITEDGVETVDLNGDGKIDHLKVTFEEPVNYHYVAPTSFTVEGYDVEDAYAIDTTNAFGAGSDDENPVYNGRGAAVVADSATVMVRVKQLDDPDTGATPDLKVVAVIKDPAGNAYDITKDAIEAVDKAAPVLLKADATAGSKNITLTFSEKVWGGTVAVPAALVAADFTYTNTVAGGSTAIASVATNSTYVTSLVVTTDAAVVAGDMGAAHDTINCAAGNVYDENGNAAGTATKILE